MKKCYRGCLHRILVENYRDARIVWEENRENGDNMRLEDDEYKREHPAPTFKNWLLANRST